MIEEAPMVTAGFVAGNPKNKFRYSIFLGLLLSLPVFLFMGRMQTRQLESKEMEQSDHLSLLVAREVGSEIGRVVDHYAYAVEALAGQVEARGTLDPHILKKMVAAQRAPFLPFASNMFVSGPHGEMIAVDAPANQSGVSDIGPTIKDRQDYQEVIRTGKMAISRARIEKGATTPVIQIAAPIHGADGKLRAVAAGSLDMNSIQPHLVQIIAGVPELKVMVIDHEGNVIANTDKNSAGEMRDLSKQPLFQAPSQSGEETRTGADEKGGSLRAAIVSILERGIDWRVVAYRPETYLKDQVAGAKGRIFLFIGAGFTGALVFTGLAFRLQMKSSFRARFSTPVHILVMTGILLIVYMPFALLGYSQVQFLKSAQIERIDREGMLASKVIARNVGQQIDRSVRVIEVLGGQAGANGNLEPKALQKIVTTQRNSFPGFTLMYIANAKGLSVAADPAFDKFGMPLAGTDYSDRDYYMEVSRTKKSFVGPVRMGRRSHVPNIQIASPILDDKGEFWAFSEGSVDLVDNISPQVERLIAGIPELTAVVMDKGGRVVAHPEKEARQEIVDLSKFTLFHSALHPEGEIRTDANERNVRVRAVAAAILTRDLNWRVVVYRPEAYIDGQAAGAQQQTWAIIGIGLIPGLLSICAAIYGMKAPAFSAVPAPQA